MPKQNLTWVSEQKLALTSRSDTDSRTIHIIICNAVWIAIFLAYQNKPSLSLFRPCGVIWRIGLDGICYSISSASFDYFRTNFIINRFACAVSHIGSRSSVLHLSDPLSAFRTFKQTFIIDAPLFAQCLARHLTLCLRLQFLCTVVPSGISWLAEHPFELTFLRKEYLPLDLDYSPLPHPQRSFLLTTRTTRSLSTRLRPRAVSAHGLEYIFVPLHQFYPCWLPEQPSKHCTAFLLWSICNIGLDHLLLHLPSVSLLTSETTFH